MSDPLDVLSLPEAREAINSAQCNEARLAQYVTAISRRLDELVGPIVERSVTELHDGGWCALRPRQTPVSSITSLTEANGTTTTVLSAETFATAPTDAYLLEQSGSYGHDARIVRRSGGSDTVFPSGRRNVELVYVAGRATNTGSVDMRFKSTAGAVLRRLWKREEGVWAQTASFFDNVEGVGVGVGFFKAVDPVVMELLHDELKPPSVA